MVASFEDTTSRVEADQPLSSLMVTSESQKIKREAVIPAADALFSQKRQPGFDWNLECQNSLLYQEVFSRGEGYRLLSLC